MTPPTERASQNTDRELWREREGDYYADSIHVTATGGIGINCGGLVIVLPIRDWHRLGQQITAFGANTQSERAQWGWDYVEHGFMSAPPSPERSPSSASLRALVEKWRADADRSKLLQGLACADELEALIRDAEASRASQP